MNSCYNKINIPYEPLIKDYDLSSQTVRHIRMNSLYFNEEFVNFIDSLRLTIAHSECFFNKEFSIGAIHSDCAGGDICKLNWIYGGEGSVVEWYNIKDGYESSDVKYTIADTPYVPYTLSQVELIEKAKLQGSYLVHVGKPHRAVNLTKNKRYCLCFVFSKSNGKRLRMQEAQEIFYDYIV